jgi:hypothetical protein
MTLTSRTIDYSTLNLLVCLILSREDSYFGDLNCSSNFKLILLCLFTNLSLSFTMMLELKGVLGFVWEFGGEGWALGGGE